MARVIATPESVEEFKKMIYFKYVFLVGLDEPTLNSDTMLRFL